MKSAYFISLSHFIPPFGGTYTFSIYIPGTEGFVPTIGVLLVLVVCVCVCVANHRLELSATCTDVSIYIIYIP